MSVDGPSLRVTWVFNNGVGPMCSRYYPPSRVSLVQAEDAMLGWFRKRHLVILDFEWAWGEVPRGLPKSRIIPVPLRAKT